MSAFDCFSMCVSACGLSKWRLEWGRRQVPVVCIRDGNGDGTDAFVYPRCISSPSCFPVCLCVMGMLMCLSLCGSARC